MLTLVEGFGAVRARDLLSNGPGAPGPRAPERQTIIFYCAIINKTVLIPTVGLNIESIVSFPHTEIHSKPEMGDRGGNTCNRVMDSLFSYHSSRTQCLVYHTPIARCPNNPTNVLGLSSLALKPTLFYSVPAGHRVKGSEYQYVQRPPSRSAMGARNMPHTPNNLLPSCVFF